MPFWAGSSIKKRDPNLGYEIVKVEDGRITFRTDLDGIARANIFLRTAERILLKIGSFKAIHLMICLKEQRNFPWKIIFQRMDASAKKASTAKSKLFSATGYPVNCQEGYG